jgi:hypothetical protein
MAYSKLNEFDIMFLKFLNALISLKQKKKSIIDRLVLHNHLLGSVFSNFASFSSVPLSPRFLLSALLSPHFLLIVSLSYHLLGSAFSNPTSF